MTQKIFIIAPHYPPSALPPSQRVRMIVPYCLENGYEPTVFTVSPKHREETEDEWMLQLLGKGCPVVEVGCLSQTWTRKIGIGDLGLRMLPFLFFALWQHARKEKPAFMLYPVPPWFILVIAPIIKWLTGVPYGIDFIDPWVHKTKTYTTYKHKLTQEIAKTLEGWVVRNASVIYAVSKPINDDIIERHGSMGAKPFFAIPYGVEASDFDSLKNTNTKNEVLTLRYIGAVWVTAYLVLDTLMAAFARLNANYKFRVEFIGTSYAIGSLAQTQLTPFIEKNKLESVVFESADRRPYKDAVRLTVSADMLFLFGDISTQYAASKLMGLVASAKPFFAFLHRESHPYRFLKSLDYPYLVGYTTEIGDTPADNLSCLIETLTILFNKYQNFVSLDLSNPLIQEHTAANMTRRFLEPISKI